MGKTAFGKIVDWHLVKLLPDGSMVLKVDRVWCHEITTPPGILAMQARGIDKVFNSNLIKATIDHVNPANCTASAIQGRILRRWCKKHHIELLDVGRNGICHAVIPEKGWILPGQIGIMGDSHTCTHGAFCAFTAGVGTTELENAIITGLWICPPQKVIRVNFVGTLPANVFAKDLALAYIKKLGTNGATNAVIEFGGSVIDEMSMDGRMTITNMAVEAGATSGMMMFDQCTLNYLGPALARARLDGEMNEISLEDIQKRVNSDADARYDQVIEIDVSDMRPVITQKYSPGDVVNVSELAGKPVDQVYIGSCTNGRIEDLRIAAGIFKRYGCGKVADGTRCIVVPATSHIYEMALKEGLISIFVNAGCVVTNPTCGACLGMSSGVIAPGEVCVSTTNRNFEGRMGEGGFVHLASPATAAVTAIEGKITEPPLDICKSIICDCCGSIGQEVSLNHWPSIKGPVPRPNYRELSNLVSGQKAKDFSGRASYLSLRDISTDGIIPARYLTATDMAEFAKHLLEDVPISPEHRDAICHSQILVAGSNFGCGSSREHAPWALRGAGIRCVIAPDFPRIFKNNMFANGLLCITASEIVVNHLFAEKPGRIDVDWENGFMSWEDPSSLETNSMHFNLTGYQKELIENGGSVGVMLNMAAGLQEKGLI